MAENIILREWSSLNEHCSLNSYLSSLAVSRSGGVIVGSITKLTHKLMSHWSVSLTHTWIIWVTSMLLPLQFAEVIHSLVWNFQNFQLKAKFKRRTSKGGKEAIGGELKFLIMKRKWTTTLKFKVKVSSLKLFESRPCLR